MKENIQEYNHQGLILMSKEKWDEAIVYFRKALNEDSYFIEAYVNIAQVYIMQDKFEEARKELNKALLLDKKLAIVYFHLGNIELLEDNVDAAREYYNKAISLGYDNIQIYINLAAHAEESADFETALSYYNRAIALEKFNAFPKARKAQVLIQLKRYPEALKACDSMIETNPDVFEGYHYKFAILSELEKWDEAEAVLDRALQLFPDDMAFFYDKARLYQAKGEMEKALQLVNEKVEMNDANRAAIIAFKCELLLAMDKMDEAEPLLDAEYERSHDGEIAFLLNSVAIAKKEYEKVLMCSEFILENSDIDNYYYSALYYRALSLKKLDREGEAKEAFTEALKFFRMACTKTPGQLQLYFYRAMCHEELQEYDKALELSAFILNVDDTIAEVHFLRYTIFKALGNMEEVQKEYSKINELNPDLFKMMEV